MKITTSGFREALERLDRLSQMDVSQIINKQLKEIYDRGQIPGTGTPYDTGYLMRSMYMNPAKPGGKEGEIGYKADYAPYVEYGHRTRNGGWVEGQYYFTKNCQQQEWIFADDMYKLTSAYMGGYGYV